VIVLFSGPAVVHSWAGRRLGCRPRLDGRPQWRGKAENRG